MYYFKKQFSIEKVIDKFGIKFKGHCQMTKLRQFSNKLHVLCARKTIHGLGEYRTSPAVRIWAKSRFYRALKAATQKQGHDWLGGWGFRRKANRTRFPGEGELAKAELEDWGCCMLGFHDVFPLSAGPFKLRFVIWASPRGWPPCCGS